MMRRYEPPAKRVKKMIDGPNWTILETIWPANERPAALQDRDWVEGQTLGDLLALQKAMNKKEQRETGQAICRASRDNKPPKVHVPGADDDCDEILAPHRFLRPPVGPQKKWYKMVPTKYSHIYRNLSVRHMAGIDSVVAPQV